MIAVAGAVSLFLLASSSIPALQPYSIVLRIVGALVIIVAVVWRKRLSERPPFRGFSRALITTGIGFGVYLVASALVHGRVQSFFLGLISFVLVACLSSVLLNRYTTFQIVDGLYAAFLLICVASLGARTLMPDVAIEQFRLRGVIENANGLGFVAFALAAVSLAAPRRPWRSILGMGIALVCLFLSGSRASMLALVVLAAVLALNGIRRAWFGVVLGIVAAGVAWLLAPGAVADVALFRTTDTRSAGFEIMQQTMTQSFWVGLGELPPGTMVAGSPYAAGITGGAWGLIGLALIYVGLVWNLASSRPGTVALVVAGIVHSVFESWILSFSAPMLLVFFVMIVGFVKLDATEAIKPELQTLRRDHVRGTSYRTIRA